MVHVMSWICLILLLFGHFPDLHAAAPLTKTAVGFAAMNARIVPLWAAKDEGFFAKNDIDGEPIFIRGAPTLNAALLSGDIQALYGWNSGHGRRRGRSRFQDPRDSYQ